MNKWMSIFISLCLCLLLPLSIRAEEEPIVLDGDGGLDDYTDLFLQDNPGVSRSSMAKERMVTLSEGTSDNQNYSYLAAFIEFPDMEDFHLDSKETIDNAELFFNDTTNTKTITDNGETLPLLSFKSYIQKYSYGKADVTTYMFPQEGGKIFSYVAPHPQDYYREKTSKNPIGYDNTIFEDGKGNVVSSGGIKQQWAREFELLNGAVDYVNAQISSLGLKASDIDVNGDARVDCISFFLEAGDYENYSSTYEYNSLLWSHKLSGCTKYMHTILGKKISAYNIILGYDSNNNAPNGSFSLESPTFGTVIHEFMHILGIPDMYRTSQQSTYPIGFYDVMATNNKVVAQPVLTYTVSGENYPVAWHDYLNNIESTTENIVLTKPKYQDSSEQNAIKICNNERVNEFFVAEYYDQPVSTSVGRGDSSGLLIYRINTLNCEKGNADGRSNQELDFCYVMRPGDSLKNQGNYGGLSSAILTKDRSSYGHLLDGNTKFDNTALYYADGMNSGIRVDVVDQDRESITINVTYTKEITGLKVNPTSLSLMVGQSTNVKATITPTDTNMSKVLVWESSNPSVASVDAKGYVRALSSGEAEISVSAINGFTASCKVSVMEQTSIDVHRLYNEKTNIHRYESDVEKILSLMDSGWKDEGAVWLSPTSSSLPVYCLEKDSTNYFYYTMDETEVNQFISKGYSQQGIAFYSDEAEGIPVYKLTKTRKGEEIYYFTSNFSEYNMLAGKKWKREGIAFYGVKN